MPNVKVAVTIVNLPLVYWSIRFRWKLTCVDFGNCFLFSEKRVMGSGLGGQLEIFCIYRPVKRKERVRLGWIGEARPVWEVQTCNFHFLCWSMGCVWPVNIIVIFRWSIQKWACCSQDSCVEILVVFFFVNVFLVFFTIYFQFLLPEGK